MCIHQITFANGWFCLNRVKPIYFLAQASEIIPILKQVYSVRLLMEQNLTLLSSLVEIVKDISSEVDNEAYHFTAQKKTGQKKKNDMNQYYISTIKVVFFVILYHHHHHCSRYFHCFYQYIILISFDIIVY